MASLQLGDQKKFHELMEQGIKNRILAGENKEEVAANIIEDGVALRQQNLLNQAYELSRQGLEIAREDLLHNPKAYGHLLQHVTTAIQAGHKSGCCGYRKRLAEMAATQQH